jgi:phenylacetate-CoA ligase
MEQRFSIFDPPARTVERLNEFRPDVLRSFGSYIEALFVHLHQSGAAFHRPKVVVYSNDAMSDQARRLVMEAFGIPLLSEYGAMEAFSIGFECERHTGYHLNSDIYPVRIVDGEGRELADGESGEVVVSNLIGRGTVLLNYRLGDVASKLPQGCPCGRSLPRLSFLEGRVDDWLLTPSGELVHPQILRTVLSIGEDDVWRYQVVQRSPSDFAIRIVAAPGSDREALQARIARRFADRLGVVSGIEFSFVESLPRTPGGKVRAVISAAGRARRPRVPVEAP